MKQFFSLVLAGTLSLSTLTFAESSIDHATSGPQAAQGEGATKRPEGKWDIDKYVNLLSGLFPAWPTKTIKRIYEKDKPLIPALEEAARKRSEVEIATILAEFFSTIEKDRYSLIEKVALSQKETLEDQETTDHEAIALMDRLNCAASGMQGKLIKNETCDSFNKAFFGDEETKKKGALKERDELNRQIFAAIDKAISPNSTDKDRKDAKKFLRKELTRDAVGAFVASQLEKNPKAALDLVEAYGWKDKKSGQYFMEFFSDGKAERLYMGKTREDIEKALKLYAERKGGLQKATVAEKEHENVKPNELMVADGKLISGRPEGVKPPKASAPVKKVAAQPAKTSKPAVSPSKPTARRQKTVSTPVRRPRVARTFPRLSSRVRSNRQPRTANAISSQANPALFDSKCQSCHSGGIKSLNAATAIEKVKGGLMPPPEKPKLSQEEKDALIAAFGG